MVCCWGLSLISTHTCNSQWLQAARIQLHARGEGEYERREEGRTQYTELEVADPQGQLPHLVVSHVFELDPIRMSEKMIRRAALIDLTDDNFSLSSIVPSPFVKLEPGTKGASKASKAAPRSAPIRDAAAPAAGASLNEDEELFCCTVANLGTVVLRDLPHPRSDCMAHPMVPKGDCSNSQHCPQVRACMHANCHMHAPTEQQSIQQSNRA